MRDLEKTREFFKMDRFAVYSGIEILEAEEHFAKCSMKICEHHLNALNSVMGGAIFTLADFTFAVASNFEGENAVTTNSQITYLGKAKGDTLIAETKLVKDGRAVCVYEINVCDNHGNKVALIISNGMKV